MKQHFMSEWYLQKHINFLKFLIFRNQAWSDADIYCTNTYELNKAKKFLKVYIRNKI